MTNREKLREYIRHTPNNSNPNIVDSFVEDILQEDGGGCILKYKYSTQVPETGYIDTIYINNTLSPEKTDEILCSLKFQPNIGDTEYGAIFQNKNLNKGIIILRKYEYSENYESYTISHGIISIVGEVETILYATKPEVFGPGMPMFTGWNPDIEDYVIVNNNNLVEDDYKIINIEATSSLFSTTKFDNRGTRELKGEYPVEDLTLTENGKYNLIDYITTFNSFPNDIDISVSTPVENWLFLPNMIYTSFRSIDPTPILINQDELNTYIQDLLSRANNIEALQIITESNGKNAFKLAPASKEDVQVVRYNLNGTEFYSVIHKTLVPLISDPNTITLLTMFMMLSSYGYVRCNFGTQSFKLEKTWQESVDFYTISAWVNYIEEQDFSALGINVQKIYQNVITAEGGE